MIDKKITIHQSSKKVDMFKFVSFAFKRCKVLNTAISVLYELAYKNNNMVCLSMWPKQALKKDNFKAVL